ncbi:MAG: hypothetical protein JNL38_29875 [Myxococcales bacterium]|jgi:hypothetical protein|nr:hypothetical protein [Myxococcales bacterium]
MKSRIILVLGILLTAAGCAFEAPREGHDDGATREVAQASSGDATKATAPSAQAADVHAAAANTAPSAGDERESAGPGPDPWIGAGPGPDPWNPWVRTAPVSHVE